MATVVVAFGALIGAVALGALVAPPNRKALPKPQWWGAPVSCPCDDQRPVPG